MKIDMNIGYTLILGIVCIIILITGMGIIADQTYGMTGTYDNDSNVSTPEIPYTTNLTTSQKNILGLTPLLFIIVGIVFLIGMLKLFVKR